MNKNKFLNELSQHLQGIPGDEVNDIIYDFEEYFNVGIQDGRSEEELAKSLGDPKSIAKQLKAEYLVKLAKSTPSIHNTVKAILATIGTGFFRVIGASLVIVGVLIFLDQLYVIDFSWRYLWPIFILIPGLGFEVSFFTNPMRGKTNISLLIPGGILTIVGILFFHAVFTDFAYIGILWPIFILAVAFGLYQFYLFGNKSEWLLIPIGVLTTVGVIFMVKNLVNPQTFGYILAIFLIILGLVMGFTIHNRSKK